MLNQISHTEAAFANATCGRSARRGSVITPALIAASRVLGPASLSPSRSGARVTAPACLPIGACSDRSSARLSLACGDRAPGFLSAGRPEAVKSVSLLDVSSPKLTRMRCSWSNEPRSGLFVSEPFSMRPAGKPGASKAVRSCAPTQADSLTTTLSRTAPIASMLLPLSVKET